MIDSREAPIVRFADGKFVDLGTTRVMGVLNVTPDSFWTASRHGTVDEALRRAEAMISSGAAILDVGGASSRPGAERVPPEIEAERVVPVIRSLRSRFAVPISVDTVKPEVAERSLDAGADMINDISALGDGRMADLAARSGAAIVLMHMRGDPRTMQEDTAYGDVVSEVSSELDAALGKAIAAGIDGDKILVDPGIGFGKDASGNLEILRRLPEFNRLGRPIMIGASRKSFIGRVLDLSVDERLEGSLAVAAVAAWQGARVIRAHDVRGTVRVVRMVDAVRGG